MAVIRPFVPARDFVLSRAFLEAIGFRPGYVDDSLAIYEQDGAGFLLQNYYVAAFAENLMLQFFVHNLNSWWQRTDRLAARFGVRPSVAPEDKPWGLRVGTLFDPAGVLWQFSETIAA